MITAQMVVAFAVGMVTGAGVFLCGRASVKPSDRDKERRDNAH